MRKLLKYCQGLLQVSSRIAPQGLREQRVVFFSACNFLFHLCFFKCFWLVWKMCHVHIERISLHIRSPRVPKMPLEVPECRLNAASDEKKGVNVLWVLEKGVTLQRFRRNGGNGN